MKIGLDFDGVIANTYQLKKKLAKEWHGLDIEEEEFKENTVVGQGLMTHEQYRKLMNTICGNPEFGLYMDEIKDALDIISKWHSRGNELKIITSREYDEERVAQEWCRLKGLDIKIISVGYGKCKSDACRGLDVYVDDDLSKLKPLREIVKNLFLFSQAHNLKYETEEGIIRTGSFAELEKAIELIRSEKI